MSSLPISRSTESLKTRPERRALVPAAGFYEFGGKDLQQWAKIETEEALGTEALLLGRKSDEWFATRWLDRTGEWAEKLNSMPKYVVSSTLKEARWSNATVLNGDVAKEVSNLKNRVDGEILVYASSQLVRTLTEHELVDEFRLVVFPVVLGTGDRLFAESRSRNRYGSSAPRPSGKCSPSLPTRLSEGLSTPRSNGRPGDAGGEPR